MNSQELETAQRIGTPFVVLVFNDESYGLIRWKQMMRFGRPAFVDFRNPDLVRYAESFGARACRIRSAGELGPALREALLGDMRFADDSILSYAAPWDSNDRVRPGSVDLLVSQAVMEHVDDVESAYGAMRRWLKPQGVMSHRIDYSCHGITHDWYGHWTVSEPMWKVARGRRAYFINRLPHSEHIAAIQASGFEILEIEPTSTTNAARPEEMRVPHTPEDLAISGALIIARPRTRE